MVSDDQDTRNLFELIARMLEYEPSGRITLAECLEHPFFEPLDASLRIHKLPGRPLHKQGKHRFACMCKCGDERTYTYYMQSLASRRARKKKTYLPTVYLYPAAAAAPSRPSLCSAPKVQTCSLRALAAETREEKNLIMLSHDVYITESRRVLRAKVEEQKTFPRSARSLPSPRFSMVANLDRPSVRPYLRFASFFEKLLGFSALLAARA